MFKLLFMESIIKQKIDLIAECIFSKIQESEKESFGLYSGEFGVLLFLFLLFEIFQK